MTILDVKNLSISFYTRNGTVKAVKNVSFNLSKGETLAIVGESGSGKSVTCYSLLDLLPKPPAKIESGNAYFEGSDLLNCDKNAMRMHRCDDIAIIFQDPMTSLNPFLTIGEQIIEPLINNPNPDKKLARKDAKLQALSLLREVGIKNADERYHSYPHEFSGGMRQRVMIAMALITEPKLLICDEPTTALDVTIQAQILRLIKKLQKNRDVAVIFISHDLGVVAGIADKVMVMCDGEIKEQDSTNEVFYKTKDEYTKKLLAAIPDGAKRLPNRSTKNILVEVKELKTYFKNHTKKRTDANYFTRAVDDVSLKVFEGEILGLVGESGSGKSTLGRSILRLAPIYDVSITYAVKDIKNLTKTNLLPYRKKMQMIFQDPYASLNPRMTVYETLSEPLLYHKVASENNIDNLIYQLMDDVGLARGSIFKYPHEFSGGQRQRIAIGRAVATKPEFIIADEPVSALDVTIQAQILDLILNLVEKHNLTMLFISHDLSVVRYISDRVVVMNAGKIIEQGITEQIWENPAKSYTQDLLSAIPFPDPIRERKRATWL
jgi:ABC-type microcin C transport system duplicated ATPase subunit YejF